jgi:xanthine dehydrogenase accessory factor
MITIFEAISQLQKENKPGILCTVVKTSGSTPRHNNSKMLVYPDGHIIGSVGGGGLENKVIQEALESLKDGNSRLSTFALIDPTRGDVGVCGGQVEVFVEPILPSRMIVVIGGGHVGKAVAHLAKWLGYRVVVSDDRREFCTAEANPDADEFYSCPLAELPQQLSITSQTTLILTTRGNEVDVAGLPSLLKTSAGYIGIIGSRRRWAETVRQLHEQGISNEEIARIHSPIGLGIGAETPEEIAVSIMAEVLMLQKDGSGRQMKEPR